MLKLKNKVAGVFLLSLGCGAAALSLGEMRGAAWVGQALDVRVAVQMDEPVGSDSSCFEAEVIYGELQQSPARVRVSLEPPSQAASAMVRILSLNPVNEPFVTVHLKAGCLAKTARRYVLLADVPAGLTGNANELSESVAASSGMGRAVRPMGEQAKPELHTQPKVLKKRTEARSISKQDVQDPAPVVQRVAKSQVRKSRLSLDPLEPLELRFERTHQELSAATMRVQMAVLPEDVPTEGLETVQKDQRLKKLEADMLSMQAQLLVREQGLSQLRDRLKQAESDRYDNLLVYALSALLMGALLTLAYLLRRQAKAQATMSEAWFESVQALNDGSDKVVVIKKPPAEQPTTLAAAQQAPSAEPAVSGHEFLDVDLDNLLEEPAHKKEEATDSSPMHRPDSSSSLGSLALGRSNPPLPDQRKLQFNKVGVKEDPRQHAEFYVSLGQSDQAIKILITAIQDDEISSPMAYLDLLKIYHAMGMRDEYKLLGVKFARLFKARVPDYAGFRNEGRDLMAYEEVIAQISGYWASHQAVAVINTFIHTDPSAESEALLDLQAFRDLLLLRAVALNKLDLPQPRGHSTRELNSLYWQG